MKKLLTFIFLFLVIICQAQVIVFKTENTSFRYAKDSTTWGSWRGITELRVNIIFDQDKQRITVYTPIEKKYAVVIKLEEYSLQDRNVLSFGCIDGDANKCVIHFVHMIDGPSYMSIQWDDIQTVYKIIKI